MKPRHPSLRTPSRQSGITMMSMLFILVVLAALGAGIASVSQRQQLGSATELMAAQAQQAAMAGLEWGSFQVLQVPAPPASAPACFGTTQIAPGGQLAAFTVSVGCTRVAGAADGRNWYFYQLSSNACNVPVAGACPNTTVQRATYVSRQLNRTVVREQ